MLRISVPILLKPIGTIIIPSYFRALGRTSYRRGQAAMHSCNPKDKAGLKSPIRVWLDCDPGHDDAFAILLAAKSPEIHLLGISIVHGNDTVDNCALNAKRFMWACGISNVPVYKGINCPIVRKPKHCPEIHGVPGEQGVAGMCGYHFPDEEIFSTEAFVPEQGHAVLKMFDIIMESESKVTVVLTGAQTNFAIALRMFPSIKDNVEKVIFMGGAIGLGNTGVAAEFNIEIDPEAAYVVFHSGLPLVMVPLEVTHSVLVTSEVLDKISKIDQFRSKEADTGEYINGEINNVHPHIEYDEIFARTDDLSRKNLGGTQDNHKNSLHLDALKCSSNFTTCCTQLLTFFRSTYKSCFSFESPPLHDPCAVYYISNPENFKTIEVFLDVEMASEKCVGRTLCDIHGIHKRKPNAVVCVKINVEQFWEKMLSCIKLADEISPMNKMDFTKRSIK